MMDEGNKSYEHQSAIVSVIFGARMLKTDQTMIKYSLRHQPEIKFKVASLKEGDFSIEILNHESSV